MKDDLQSVKEKLLQAISKEGLPSYLGAYPSEGVPEIQWNSDLEADPAAFIGVAKSLGAKVIYVNWIVFAEQDLNEAMIEAPERNEAVDDTNSSVDEYNEKVKEFEGYIGKMASVRAGFLLDGIFHAYEQETKWYEEFGGLVSTEESDGETGGASDHGHESKLSDEALSWAEKLARDPSFGRTKGWSQREYLLTKLAGQETSHLPVDSIIRRAEAVYEVDVRPSEQKQLAEQVRQMKASGLSIVAIAGKLDLPREHVQRFLAKIE
jgi:hypothetical protein